ncbi:MAG: hypothetical protein WBI94_01425, partial [Candidatus Cloacimonadaceae bacterium]
QHKKIHSLFWMVLEGKPEREGAKIGKWDKWRDRISHILARCIEEGYYTGSSQEDKKKSQGITRSDLQQSSRKQQEES